MAFSLYAKLSKPILALASYLKYNYAKVFSSNWYSLFSAASEQTSLQVLLHKHLES